MHAVKPADSCRLDMYGVKPAEGTLSNRDNSSNADLDVRTCRWWESAALSGTAQLLTAIQQQSEQYDWGWLPTCHHNQAHHASNLDSTQRQPYSRVQQGHVPCKLATTLQSTPFRVRPGQHHGFGLNQHRGIVSATFTTYPTSTHCRQYSTHELQAAAGAEHASAGFSSLSTSGAGDIHNVADVCAAAQPLEQLSTFDPVIFATSVWESFHSTTGLPWWASIPLTTLCLRSLLLPLTLKARAGSLNFGLMQQASATASMILDKQQQQQQQGATSSSRLPAALPQSHMQLARAYYSFLRKQHGTPSTLWFGVNAFAQVTLTVM